MRTVHSDYDGCPKMCTGQTNIFQSAFLPAALGEEEWQKEYVNGSQAYVLKGLKEGLSYRVRMVAKGHDDQAVLHQSEELLVTVPGEAAHDWLVVTGAARPRLALPCVVVEIDKRVWYASCVILYCLGTYSVGKRSSLLTINLLLWSF